MMYICSLKSRTFLYLDFCNTYALIGVPGEEYPKLADVGREFENSEPASEPRSLLLATVALGVEGRSPKTNATRSSIAFLSLPAEVVVVL